MSAPLTPDEILAVAHIRPRGRRGSPRPMVHRLTCRHAAGTARRTTVAQARRDRDPACRLCLNDWRERIPGGALLPEITTWTAHGLGCPDCSQLADLAAARVRSGREREFTYASEDGTHHATTREIR